MGDLTRYLVTWHLSDSPDDVRHNRVIVEEGYSTVDDVPRILGTGLALDAANIVVTRAVVGDSKYRRLFKSV